jgi:hypothetical protein
MKTKLLSFVFIYFLELGLFKGLRPIQIKKTFSPNGSSHSFLGAIPPGPTRWRNAATRISYHILLFWANSLTAKNLTEDDMQNQLPRQTEFPRQRRP